MQKMILQLTHFEAVSFADLQVLDDEKQLHLSVSSENSHPRLDEDFAYRSLPRCFNHRCVALFVRCVLRLYLETTTFPVVVFMLVE